ncbi:TolC family outer membrane protein [Alkalilimnicola ehrlichii]|nr:TolC family outer membrane protein [Alkalilimnicola ehrlichii]
MRLRPILKTLALAGILSSLPVQAESIDLLTAFRLASEHDPQIAAAREQLQADREQLPQARSLILPQIGLQADANRIWQDQSLGDAPPFPIPDDSVSYNTYTVGVGLTQALFRPDSYIRQRQARSVIDQAEINYRLAQQQLALRVAESYFRVLEAQDAVTTFDAEVRAIERQLQRSERAFELGAGTVTDVNEARARMDGARAQRVAAQSELRIARESLRRIIETPFEHVSGVGAEFDPEPPQPADAEAWATLAEQHNLQVQLAQSGLELASSEIRRSRTQRLPQVDLVANYGRSYQGDGANPTLGTSVEVDQASIGVQLSVPLYTGGAISSQVRAASAQREVTYNQLLSAKREAAIGAESAYLGLLANMERVRALEQALRSITSMEESVQRGLELGLRTTLDLLNVQRERFQTERELAAARYGYLLTYMQLQAVVGEPLDEELFALVNRYLMVNQ